MLDGRKPKVFDDGLTLELIMDWSNFDLARGWIGRPGKAGGVLLYKVIKTVTNLNRKAGKQCHPPVLNV